MNNPKFKIGNIVSYRNEFSFNHASNVTSIGKVNAIHIHNGVGLFNEPNMIGKVLYDISGSSCLIEESELMDYNE